ncbi:MAG: transcriptional regulator [Deltaproteobacteria bacterium]|nr:transcriptional regulator [Deltaproteobacteria bacterium]
MKMLILIYDVDYEEDITDFITSLNVEAYTKWNKVLGKGRISDPRMDDAVWPGFNSVIMIVTDDNKAENIVKTGKELSDKLGNKRFKLFELPVNRVI